MFADLVDLFVYWMMDDAWKHCMALEQRRLEEEQRALGNDAMSCPLS